MTTFVKFTPKKVSSNVQKDALNGVSTVGNYINTRRYRP